jgi:hypothetical protein
MNAQIDESILVRHRKNDGFNEFGDLLVTSANVAVLLGGALIHFHCFDTRIVLGRQLFENQVGVLEGYCRN